jgi:excisionase family DNA binding protein
MFCTLQEAARTLHADEDQIEALLRQGVLSEFRAGEHRLVRETDVGALALLCQPAAARSPAHPARPGTRASCRGIRAKPKVKHPTIRPGAQSAGTTPRASGKHKTKDMEPRTHGPARGTPDRRLQRPAPAIIAPASPVRRGPSPIIETRPVESLSVRQWFWAGLVQDRPAAIALLAGLVLLLLAAVVAGACFMAEAV